MVHRNTGGLDELVQKFGNVGDAASLAELRQQAARAAVLESKAAAAGQQETEGRPSDGLPILAAFALGTVLTGQQAEQKQAAFAARRRAHADTWFAAEEAAGPQRAASQAIPAAGQTPTPT
ncbi:MAG: hypothetical protein B7W99_00840 [Rhodospirillales bacterium 20-58-10]|nr:MAG: hypothetical protein B7W99_00840 [Rhodospirillales bacterium 20-58-10]